MRRAGHVVIAMVLATACERASDSSGNQPGGGATVTVPPALPGEPPIGADREAMLQKFATNISQSVYTVSNLTFLLCNSEAGQAVANQSGDPMTKGLMRRMVALFRSAPGMAKVVCPRTPPRTP